MSKRKRGGKQASPSFEGWQTLSCDDAGLDADEMSELVSIEVLDGGDEPLLRRFEKPEAARQKKGKKGAKAEANAKSIAEAEKVTTRLLAAVPASCQLLHNASTRHALLS